MIIETVLGPMDTAQLTRKVVHTNNEREKTNRVEYWFEGVCVRADVHIELKQGIGIEGIFGQVG